MRRRTDAEAPHPPLRAHRRDGRLTFDRQGTHVSPTPSGGTRRLGSARTYDMFLAAEGLPEILPMLRVPHRPAVVPSVLTGLCVLSFLLDASVVSRSQVGLAVLASGILALGAAAAQPWMYRTGRQAVACGLSLGAAACSLITTSWVQGEVLQRTPGWTELCGLLALLSLTCRHARPSLVMVCSVPLFVAVMRTQERAPVVSDLPVLRTIDGLFVLLPMAFVLLGGYQRGEDGRRRAAARDIRRAERLDLARDLHDHVAHYVTAIVVQAQAGEHIMEKDPATARRLFGTIEQTGQDGLVAMQRMVRLLRTAETATVEAPVTPAMTGIKELVRRAGSAGQHVSLEVDEGVKADDWPPQLAKTAKRLVQEGLTNVRKHARSASAVQVRMRAAAGRLVIHVRDNGTGRHHGRSRFPTSGFGMIGLRERVGELGGELSSGPLPEGGWELSASIPLNWEDRKPR
ncbi:sensor histidine kinase [Streptomyces xiamenensis]|uniref:sensor histidine kinase n=1 Tax=Streptomyces xiamenensis TaxID=408015 RepID=UPI0036B700AA